MQTQAAKLYGGGIIAALVIVGLLTGTVGVLLVGVAGVFVAALALFAPRNLRNRFSPLRLAVLWGITTGALLFLAAILILTADEIP